MTLEQKEAWVRALFEDHADEPRLTDLRWAVEVIDSVQDDNARLRALVKEREWVGSCCYDPFCPWCGDPSTYENTTHAASCPAFTPDGKVK